MKLLSLDINGQAGCSVTMPGASWLPVRPRLPKSWLRSLYSSVLRSYFGR